MVFTGVGDKAFCTGGNTKEYAEYYAGHPQEYRQYMRLFNDMVSAILACDKPVICRVNGMRIGGGQEIGMACDFSVAQDLARFGQAGPKHGSAPIGGATDFLPLIVGAERAMAACVLCEPFSAHKAYHMGILTDIVPALKVDGKFVANPLVETQRLVDEFGRFVFGEPKSGDAAKEGKALLTRGTVDLSLLDAKVEELCAKILLTFPDCTTKTLEELRKPKLEAWNRNKEDSRAWLALNMMTEARSGFIAFNEGTKEDREVDFVLLRQKLAAGESWVGPLHDSIQPKARRRARTCASPIPRFAPPPSRGRMGGGWGAPLLRRRTHPHPRPPLEGEGGDRGSTTMSDSKPLKDWLELDGALLRLRLARPKANIVDAEMIAALRRRAARPPRADDAARRAARRRGAELQLRRQRRGTPARAVRADARLAARADPGDDRVPGADPGRRARPVPRRRARGGARRRADLRRARCAVRPAGDEARRVRAGRLGAAAVPRQPAVRRGPAVFRPLDRRRRGARRSASCTPCSTTRRPRRWRTSTSTSPARARRAGLRAGGGARGAMIRDVRQRLAEVERLYLDRLMDTRDANEGLTAFLAKRKPQWEHR